MPTVTMNVNGKSVDAEVENRTLLSTALREGLGMTGTHIGCDTSQCGACVVHVNGKAVKSCSMFAVEAAGAEVSTIEGQANADGSLNVIQQAFQWKAIFVAAPDTKASSTQSWPPAVNLSPLRQNKGG